MRQKKYGLRRIAFTVMLNVTDDVLCEMYFIYGCAFLQAIFMFDIHIVIFFTGRCTSFVYVMCEMYGMHKNSGML